MGSKHDTSLAWMETPNSPRLIQDERGSLKLLTPAELAADWIAVERTWTHFEEDQTKGARVRTNRMLREATVARRCRSMTFSSQLAPLEEKPRR